MGYIGDSRAILASKDSNDSMVAIQLTVDLKPDLPSMFYFGLGKRYSYKFYQPDNHTGCINEFYIQRMCTHQCNR